MAPTDEHEQHPTVPDVIRLEREPGGPIRVYIDGVLFPHAIAADPSQPIVAELVANTVPAVRLTLIAKSVEVSDRLLADTHIPGHDSDGP